MFLNILKKNLFRCLLFSLIGSSFIILVFVTNYQENYSEVTYNNYLNLPIYLKLIFLFLIPILGDLDYLFQFTMIYLIPLTLVYSISLGLSANITTEFEETLPLNRQKRKLINVSVRLLLLGLFILFLALTTVIVTSFCYQKVAFFVINGYLYLLLINLVCFGLAYFSKGFSKFGKKVFLITSLVYLTGSFILASLLKNTLLYNLSPLNILLQPEATFSIYLLPLTLLIIVFIYILIRNKRHE